MAFMIRFKGVVSLIFQSKDDLVHNDGVNMDEIKLWHLFFDIET